MVVRASIQFFTLYYIGYIYTDWNDKNTSIQCEWKNEDEERNLDISHSTLLVQFLISFLAIIDNTSCEDLARKLLNNLEGARV